MRYEEDMNEMFGHRWCSVIGQVTLPGPQKSCMFFKSRYQYNTAAIPTMVWLCGLSLTGRGNLIKREESPSQKYSRVSLGQIDMAKKTVAFLKVGSI
jgi:hypothetical protein